MTPRTEPAAAPLDRPSQRGLSLIEVLVGVSILAFVALGVMAFLGTSIRQNQSSLERSLATGIASERIQQITSLPYQTQANYANYKLAEETAATGPPPTLTTALGQIPGQPRFSRTVTLSYDSPMPGMLRVQVDVAWQSLYQNQTKTTRMITYLHPGLEQAL